MFLSQLMAVKMSDFEQPPPVHSSYPCPALQGTSFKLTTIHISAALTLALCDIYPQDHNCSKTFRSLLLNCFNFAIGGCTI